MTRLLMFSAVAMTFLMLILSWMPTPLATPIPNPILERYRPGQPLPGNAYCEYFHGYDYGHSYCTIDGAVFMSYSRDDNQIVSVSIADARYTVGEYIAAWGDPDGIETWGSNYSRTLWWKDMSVYTAGEFRPSNKTYFIRMGPRPDDVQPWQGFKSRYK